MFVVNLTAGALQDWLFTTR